MEIKVWGSRGSIPVPGPGTNKFGGNTSCVTVAIDDLFIIFDAGTGIRSFGNWLIRNKKKLCGSLFFTHFHWDHIQGFPFFMPVYSPETKLNIYGHDTTGTLLNKILKGQMDPPFFPVGIEMMGGQMIFSDFSTKKSIDIKSKSKTLARIKSKSLRHPGGSVGYRLEDIESGKTFVYATDTEHADIPDENLIHLAQDADVLFYDAQYTTEEYYGLNGQLPKKDWGHSTWKEGLKIAEAAGVKDLFLFHHDPNHDDDMLLRMENAAQTYLKQNNTRFTKLNSVQMVYEGLVIKMPADLNKTIKTFNKKT